MKWSELSFKDKKQIYDSIRASNPNTTYLDIKSQFDSIPAYEDGGKKIMPPKELGLTPGTPEYYKRQQQISGRAELVQPEAYITPEAVNKNQYSNEILRSVDQALYPDEDTRKLVREIDKAYNTNYEKAYSDIAYKEITGRKDYVSYGSMGDNIYGKANMKNIQDGFTSSNVDDYSIVLDPSTYVPGTANHELGHMADGIAGSIKYEAEPGVDYITNPYLRYLADPSNTYTTKELRDAGFHSAAKNKRCLLNPTESKSHMLTLKRALKDSNKISKWSDPVDENMILDYFRSGRANGAVRNQYDLYIDKQRYIDRLNRLVPMEWLLPTIGLGGAEFLREKQNNKSN